MVIGMKLSNLFESLMGTMGFIVLVIFLAGGGPVNAQMRSRKVTIMGGKPKLVRLQRTSSVPKTSSPTKPAVERPFLYNVSRQQIQELKSKRVAPGMIGGTSVFDGSEKISNPKKRLFKTMAPVAGQGFDGIVQGDASTSYYPPDPILAASGNEIIQIVNDAFQVTDTTGQEIYYESLYDLFSDTDSTGDIFDPKVVYDPRSGRFILVCLYENDFNETSQYLMAVSEDSTDPGGLWWTYSFDATSDGTNPSPYMADFPGLGFDSTSIYITSNQYGFVSGNFKYARLLIMDKASIDSGNYPISEKEFYDMTNADGSTVFTLKPATIISSSANEYLLNTESDGGNYVTAWTISYSGGTPSLSRSATVAIGNYIVPPDAQQAGSTSLIATGDCRTQEVVWKDNELYTAFTEGYNWGSGPVAAVRILKINTNTWAADRNVNFGANGISYFYPAVTPNDLDQTFLVFNSSSASEDVDIRAAAEVWADSSSVYIDGGYSNYEDPRWGDYSGISLSPTGTVWCTAEEAFNQYTWGTAIAPLTQALGPIYAYMEFSDSTADFAGVRVETSATLRFSISNLESSSGVLSGTATVENSRFTILQGGTFSLSPGKENDVVLRYNAVNSGFMYDTLIVTNNSSNYSNQVKIPIVAYGVSPSQNPKRVMLDLADDYYGYSDSTYFVDLISDLRARGNTVVLEDSTFDLRGLDYFVSATPYQDYTPAQVSALQSFVKAGGGLIVLPYAYYSPGSQFQNDLLSAPGWTTGITITNEIVEDATEEIDSTSTWVKLFTFPHPNDPVVAGIDTLGVFSALNLSVAGPADSLVLTSSSASADFMKLQPVNGRYPRLNGQTLSGKEGEQILGAAASGSLPVVVKADVGSGQIIVYGSEEIFAQSEYYPASFGYPPYYLPGIRYQKNRVLALNSFETQTGPPVVAITSVQDVPNDAGKQVRLTWKPEYAAGPSPIRSFAVWRFDSVWTFISQIPSDGDSIYSIIVPTLADSGSKGTNYTMYRLTAYTSNESEIFYSLADSGYSVNNLGITSVPAPVITSIADVPNDEGHQAELVWRVNGQAAKEGITGFSIWRRDSVWTFLTEVTATDDSVYSYVAPTLYDSTITSGMHYSYFRITAHSSDPAILATSAIDSGYSVDNLAPHTPANLMAHSVDTGYVALSWSPVADKDLQYYRVYRSGSSGFVADSATLIGTSIDTVYTDRSVEVGSQYYYRIEAVDFSGNQSPASASAGLVVTSVKGGNSLPTVFSLAQNYPNPFNPTTNIEYQVSNFGLVSLKVYDVLGREVATLVNGVRSPGTYEVRFNGSTFASGVYFYRLFAPGVNIVRKMLLEK